MVGPASPSRPAQRDSARLEIVHERDEHGSVYAVEIVEAARWDAALLRPPDPEAADARIVRLQA
ncbi:MAG: hypothetical protein O2895_04260, partial [Chloroflexi bacterium]|nr:hypothetical protein [Chloroflexota bacterium]